MNVTCNDRDRIFEDGTSVEWAALEAHASGCPACAEEVRAWKALSVAAQELRDYSESPALWTRIERALTAEGTARPEPVERRSWFSFLPSVPVGWQAAAVGALI